MQEVVGGQVEEVEVLPDGVVDRSAVVTVMQERILLGNGHFVGVGDEVVVVADDVDEDTVVTRHIRNIYTRTRYKKNLLS